MNFGSVGPQPGASQIVGSSSLPASPTFRQVYITPSGFSACLVDGSWTTFASGEVTGSGTANTVTKFTGTSAIGNSLITDDGTTFAININKFTVIEASGNTFFAGVLSGGSGPTTITDSAGKILSAALNTVGAAQGGTGVANNAASTIAISGNFATTFTVTGITGVTLPTTGTLLTTTGSGAGLSGVTLSAIVPNTAPSAGQILAGNAGGTAYAPISISGDATLASAGALTLASVISAGGPTGSATVAPIITYDAKGRLTAVSSATITPAVGSITGLGTGVATALAVNVGSAGAFVVNGGALGSPSSAGTIPAFTLGGTIAGGGNQLNNIIIGTSTPLAGTFTAIVGTSSAINGTETITSASATALTVGRLGATTPAFQVDASTATSITGIKIKSAASGGGVAISAIGEASNGNLTLDAQGSGTITIGGISTGAITLTRATTMSNALTYGGVTLSNAVTGTGNMVLSASPTFTGTLAAATLTATTFNGLAITNNGTNTLNITAGKSLNLSNTLTFTGTDSSSVAFSAGGTVAYSVTTGNGVSATNTAGALAFTLGAITPSTIVATSTIQGTKLGAGIAPVTAAFLQVKMATDIDLIVRNGTDLSVTGPLIDAVTDSAGARIQLNLAGTPVAILGGGLNVGSPTGGDKGAGTANFAGLLYSNNTAGVSAGSFSAITAITSTGGIVTQLTGTSDERLKKIAGSFTRGLKELRSIEPIRFKWTDRFLKFWSQKKNPEMIGFSAQNVRKVIPEAIGKERWADKSEWLSFNNQALFATMVNSIKELAARVEQLEAV